MCNIFEVVRVCLQGLQECGAEPTLVDEEPRPVREVVFGSVRQQLNLPAEAVSVPSVHARQAQTQAATRTGSSSVTGQVSCHSDPLDSRLWQGES